jgi:hypothetical protein
VCSCPSEYSSGYAKVFNQQQQHIKTPILELSRFTYVVEEPKPEKTLSGATPLNDGVDRELVEAAFAVTAHNTVEAFLTPAGAPAVLDDPVVLGAFSAVANNGDAVVEA